MRRSMPGLFRLPPPALGPHTSLPAVRRSTVLLYMPSEFRSRGARLTPVLVYKLKVARTRCPTQPTAQGPFRIGGNFRGYLRLLYRSTRTSSQIGSVHFTSPGKRAKGQKRYCFHSERRYDFMQPPLFKGQNSDRS